MIHRFEHNGYRFLLDIPTGSIHLVDELVYQLLERGRDYRHYDPSLLDNHKRHDIEEALLEIDALVEQGLLFSVDKTKDLITRFPKETRIKALCLHVAHDCNLRCSYCFASTGDFQGSRELMSLETGKKALDFLVAHSGKRYHLEVDFFGGEPLMNWDVVKALVHYGRSLEKEHNKQFRFTLTTNGVLLNDEITEFLNAEMSNVVLSLDGRKETNDRMRKTIAKTGSYDVIVPKFQSFVEKRGDQSYYVRGTFTAQELNFCDDVLHMQELGFKELSMEPVVAEPGLDYTLKEEDLDTIYQQYELLAEELLKKYNTPDEFRFFHYELDLEGGPCAIKKSGGCGAGSEYLAVTPTGDLYPCHQFVGQEEFRLGNLQEGLTHKNLLAEFSSLNVFEKSACDDCWTRYYCSGGCHANAWNFNNDLRIPYDLACKLERKRVEMAIYIAVRKREAS